MKHTIITLCLAMLCSIGLAQATSTAHEYLPDKVLSYGQSSIVITPTQEMTADCSEVYVNFSLIQKSDIDEILPDATRKEKRAFLREIKRAQKELNASELLHTSNVKLYLSDCNELLSALNQIQAFTDTTERGDIETSISDKLRLRCTKEKNNQSHFVIEHNNTVVKMPLYNIKELSGLNNQAMTEVILSRLKSGSIRDTTELFLLHAATAS